MIRVAPDGAVLIDPWMRVASSEFQRNKLAEAEVKSFREALTVVLEAEEESRGQSAIELAPGEEEDLLGVRGEKRFAEDSIKEESEPESKRIKEEATEEGRVKTEPMEEQIRVKEESED